MSLGRHYVRAAVDAFLETLDRLSPKERAGPVQPRFADELNSLLELARELLAEREARRLPPPVAVQRLGGGYQVLVSYADLEATAHQLARLIPDEPMFGSLW